MNLNPLGNNPSPPQFTNCTIQAAQPRTQYEQLCEAISERMGLLSSEISMLHSTCSPILPGEPAGDGKAGTNVKPVGHSSPMMNFLEHVGETLAQMEERVRYIRVRTPFYSWTSTASRIW